MCVFTSRFLFIKRHFFLFNFTLATNLIIWVAFVCLSLRTAWIMTCFKTQHYHCSDCAAVPRSNLLTAYLPWPIFLDLLSTAGNSRDSALQGGQEGETGIKHILLYNQQWWVIQWLFCLVRRSQWKITLPGLPLQSHPLNGIFISWVRCRDAERAEREFKTYLVRLHLQLQFTYSPCGRCGIN